MSRSIRKKSVVAGNSNLCGKVWQEALKMTQKNRESLQRLSDFTLLLLCWLGSCRYSGELVDNVTLLFIYIFIYIFLFLFFFSLYGHFRPSSFTVCTSTNIIIFLSFWCIRVWSFFLMAPFFSFPIPPRTQTLFHIWFFFFIDWVSSLYSHLNHHHHYYYNFPRFLFLFLSLLLLPLL